MTKEKRALWALDVMGGIDAALVEEAEQPPRRAGRRMAYVAVAAAALAVLAIGGTMMLRRAETVPPIDPAPDPVTTAHVHAQSSGIIAVQIAHIRWQGVSYELTYDATTIVPGEQLGVIEFCSYFSCTQALPDNDPRRRDMSLTASNVIPVGAPIYACAGCPTAWRICAYDANGELLVFERESTTSAGESLTGRAVGELFPALAMVEQIDLFDGAGFLLAEIDEPARIAALLTPFTEAVFITRDDAAQMVSDTPAVHRDLVLHLTDGSTTTISLSSRGWGRWLEYVRLPDGLVEAASALAVFPGGDYDSDYDFDYGNTAANNIGLMGEYQDDYESFTVWLTGSRLYLGSSHGSNRRVLLTDDAAGDIRIEGLDVWYRTTAGAVARITFACPGIGSFYSLSNKGVDMTDFITAHEIVDEGPYVRFQLRLGVRWTLDAAGRLARDGVIVAESVRDFNLDADGVVYATADGACRRAGDGTIVRLTDQPVTAIATAGLYVYYATEAGELHRVRCDGAKDTLLGHLACTKLAFTRCNASSADCLAILTADGRACLLMDGTLYTIADGVTDLDAHGPIYLTLTMADGSSTTGQLDYAAQSDDEHGDPAGLQFEGRVITDLQSFR